METIEKVNIEINKDFVPELFDLLNDELQDTKSFAEGTPFCQYSSITKTRVDNIIENLTDICSQLLEKR